MHALKLAAICQLSQIAPDGLMGNAKMLGQAIDGDFTLAPGDFQNVGMAKSL